MKIYCIGDSLTEGDYGVFGKRGIANVHKENYPYFLSLLTGNEVINCGKCGYTSSSYLEYYMNGNVKAENADMIIVILGTNGGMDGENDTQGNRDYEKLLDLMKKDSPEAKIFICTPPHVTEDPDMSGCGCKEKVEKAASFVRKFAKENSYELLDLLADGTFNAETEKIYQSNDGVHFVEAGYKKLAEIIAKKTEQI